MKTIIILIALFACTSFTFAQDSHDSEVLTLSKGKYREIFDNDTIEIITGAVLDTKNKKVIGYIEEEELRETEEQEQHRFFAVDPLAPKYPHNSPYAFSENSTIAFIELEGLEKYYSADGNFIGSYSTSSEIRIIRAEEVEFAKSQFGNENASSGYFKYYLPAVSKDLQNAAKGAYRKAANQIVMSIYKENGLYSVKTINFKDMKWGRRLDLDDGNKAAHTINGEVIELNTNVEHAASRSILSDYYNLVNILYHESLHAKRKHMSNGDVTGFEHFDIFREQVKHSSFEKMTDLGKDYLFSVASNYLSQMSDEITDRAAKFGMEDKKVNSMIDKYMDSIKFFEEVSGKKLNSSGSNYPTTKKDFKDLTDFKKGK